MGAFKLIQEFNPETARMVYSLARKLEELCAVMGKKPESCKLLVFWGGGKDSTLSLILAKAIVERTGSSLCAITMDNPGMTVGTISNIDRVRSTLQVNHEYWHFTRPVKFIRQYQSDWQTLYRALYFAVGGHPRFMCVACNMGSIVTEYSALVRHKADFLITGNPVWELDVFDQWVVSLKEEFNSLINFPNRVNNPSLDYYRFWHAIYSGLLEELFLTNTLGELTAAQKLYLYEFPENGSQISNVARFAVLDHEGIVCRAIGHRGLLAKIGWQFPEDLQGGTESDCGFTATIAHLNIARKGLAAHLTDLQDARDHFQTLPEMHERAIDWALSGKSAREGKRLLPELGLSEEVVSPPSQQSGIAKALIEKLFKIR